MGTPELLSDWMVSLVEVKYQLDCYGFSSGILVDGTGGGNELRNA
jgi:hypothetical protein